MWSKVWKNGIRYRFIRRQIEFYVKILGQERNEQYVVQVETHLARFLNVDGLRSEEDSLKWVHRNRASQITPYATPHRTSLSSSVPSHFYGELVKTPEGCQILEEKGHFLDFADFIRDSGLENQDLEGLLRLKSILWAVVRLLHL